MRIEAKNLEEAYSIASSKLNCSITDLDIEVIQYPSKGILGLFSKPAIIEVKKKEKIYSIDEVIDIVKKDLSYLMKVSCFNVDVKDVYKIDDITIGIKLDGEDTALLIGKEGYRFNALNTLLYSWINQKYGFKIQLEVGNFIKEQTEVLKEYLRPIIEQAKENVQVKTRPLNGILVYIALDILRKEFPNRYVAIKEKNGEKFIVVGKNGHNSSNSDS